MIENINSHNLNEVIPLIRSYQEFYKIEDIDDDKNKIFFSQFGIDSNQGCLFGYRINNKMVAFATIYFTYATSSISKIAIMNDLYVVAKYRKQKIGTMLIKHCKQYAKSQGSTKLQWLTAPDNLIAQKVYKSLGAEQSSWERFTYST